MSENISEKNFSSDISELAIQSLLVEWKERGLDRKVHQDPDRDIYTSDEEGTIVCHVVNELELTALSKRPTRLFPHTTVVRNILEPLGQEATTVLLKTRCIKMKDDAHAPEVVSGQLHVMETYLKARYQLSDLLRAQIMNRMTKTFNRWIENGSPDKGDLEEDML